MLPLVVVASAFARPTWRMNLQPTEDNAAGAAKVGQTWPRGVRYRARLTTFALTILPAGPQQKCEDEQCHCCHNRQNQHIVLRNRTLHDWGCWFLKTDTAFNGRTLNRDLSLSRCAGHDDQR